MFPGVCIAIPHWRDNGKQFSMRRSVLMEPRTLQYMADACEGCRLTGSPETVAHRVCTDSRAAQRGDLFVALSGERYDGHAFLDEVARKGAAGLLVERPKAPSPSPDCGVIAVDNTRQAFGRIAARYRRDFSLPLIAVAGSNGKTTTKNLLAAVLSRRFNTLSSQASFNNDIGVPTTLLQLDKNHEVAVLEFGANHPGELAPLLGMAAPQIGVVTSIGREHLEFFGDLRGVLDEEGSIAEILPAGGKLFVNGDSWGVEEIERRARVAVVRAGFAAGNQWRSTRVRMDESGTAFSVQAGEPGFCRDFRIRLFGRHQVINTLLAIAVAAELGLTPGEVEEGLLACAPAKMRLEFCVINRVRVLDDSYNANADSMRAALETLRDFPCRGRRVAVLGDMAELGAHAAEAHAEVGRFAAAARVDHLLAVGSMASVTSQAARDAGLNSVQEFVEISAAAEALRDFVGPDDLVLLKASRIMALERVKELLGQAAQGPVGDMSQRQNPRDHP